VVTAGRTASTHSSTSNNSTTSNSNSNTGIRSRMGSGEKRLRETGGGATTTTRWNEEGWPGSSSSHQSRPSHTLPRQGREGIGERRERTDRPSSRISSSSRNEHRPMIDDL
jgi:hypothetical protein